MQGPIGGCTQHFNLKLYFYGPLIPIILRASSLRLSSERRIGDWRGPGLGAGLFSGIGHQVHCALCSIIPVGGNWIVQCGTVDHGPFVSKGTAVRRAFAEARAVHAKGQRSRVSVQDGSGRVSTEHCLCADFKAVRGFGRSSRCALPAIVDPKSCDVISDRRRWRRPPLRKDQFRDGSPARKY